MIKRLFIALVYLFLWTTEASAQNIGMQPISCIRYSKSGISVKSITTKLNGAQLMSNRIPLNAEVSVNLQQLTGFTTDKQKNIFPAARFSLINSKGDTIDQMNNLLLLNQAKGFSPKDLAKGLDMKFGIREGLVQPNSKCMIIIRIYDQKGKNQLLLQYPVSIAYPRENIPTAQKAAQLLPSPAGSTMMAFGLGLEKNITLKIDTAVKYNSKLAYMRIEILKLAGVDVISMLQGTETCWVYDTLYHEIKARDRLLKDVGGIMGTNAVNCTLQIPFRLKTDPQKGYIIRYRWEGPDRTQAFEIVAEVK